MIYKIYIKIDNQKKCFFILNDFQNTIYNILATLAVMKINKNVFKLDKNIFLNFLRHLRVEVISLELE